MAHHFLTDEVEQFVQGRALAKGHVVDLVAGFVRGEAGQQVGLHHVVDVAEVAAGLAVAVDEDGLFLQQAGEPLGDDGGVGAVGILTPAKDVEVAQAHGGEAVAAGEDVGVELVHILGHGIGRQGVADLVFHLGQLGGIAVGGGGRGVDEALHARIARGHQHVEVAGDVAAVGQDGIVDGARHGTQGGFMQHMIHTFAGLAAGIQIADVAFDEGEAAPGFGAHQGFHHVQVLLVTGEEVVQTHHGLPHLEQMFQQVGTDETGNAGHQPGGGFGTHFFAQLGIGAHIAFLIRGRGCPPGGPAFAAQTACFPCTLCRRRCQKTAPLPRQELFCRILPESRFFVHILSPPAGPLCLFSAARDAGIAREEPTKQGAGRTRPTRLPFPVRPGGDGLCPAGQTAPHHGAYPPDRWAKDMP